jgi:hypothetical protein
MTFALLASMWFGGGHMFRTTTHFEQVPLEIVMKIIEEQTHGEIATDQGQITNEEKTRVTVTSTSDIGAGGGQS